MSNIVNAGLNLPPLFKILENQLSYSNGVTVSETPAVYPAGGEIHTGAMVDHSKLLPLLIKRSLVELPFGRFPLELLIQGIG